MCKYKIFWGKKFGKYVQRHRRYWKELNSHYRAKITTKMKRLDGPNSRMNNAEKRISKFKDRTLEMDRTMKQKKMDRKIKKQSMKPVGW